MPLEPWRGSGPAGVDSVGFGQSANIPPGLPLAAAARDWGIVEG